MKLSQRTTRSSITGIVSNRSGDKTVKVTYAYKIPHPVYKKEINRKTVLHVHDEKNICGIGDKVRVMETRPISKLKRWRIIEVITKSNVTESHNVENI